MEPENNNSRRSFFKKMLLSAGATVLANEVFSAKHEEHSEHPKHSEKDIKKLNENEINEEIKNIHISGSKKIKPEPAPSEKADNIQNNSLSK